MEHGFPCPLDVSFNLTQRLQAVLCIDSLFIQYSCCCGLQMCARNVSCGWSIRLQSFPDAWDGYTFPLSWVTCWIKWLIAVRFQSFTSRIVQLLSSLWRPLRFPTGKLCKDQILGYWKCRYFRLWCENNCIEFELEMFVRIFPAIVWFTNIWPFYWFFQEGVCHCHETLSVWIWCWT